MAAYSTYTDQELVALIKQGDVRAFDHFYNLHWTKVYGHAYKRLQNMEQAKDITQEVFVNLWERRNDVHIENVPGYFFISVRNNVFKLQRKEQLFTPVNDILEEVYASPNQADALLLEHEFFKSLGSLIDTLPPAQQQIFRMRYQEDLSTKEISERLQISVKTVQNQLGRALAQLRTLMALMIIMCQINNKS